MNSTNNEGPVLVVGATGVLGMEICRQLREENKQVRALVRITSDPAKVDALKQSGVETVTGDMKDPSSLGNAFRNVSSVISTATSTISRQEGDSIESVDEAGQINVVQAATDAGVQHFVFISFSEMPGIFPLQNAKRKVEKKLMESGMDYTILRPTMFMEIWLGPALGFDFNNSKATIYGEGNNKSCWIALKDVASFAVASLKYPAAINTIMDLGGPEALSPFEVVKIFEQETGQPFNLQHVPIEAIYNQKESATDSLTKSFASLMLGYAQGSLIDMKTTLEVFPIRLTTVKDYAKRVMAPQTQQGAY